MKKVSEVLQGMNYEPLKEDATFNEINDPSLSSDMPEWGRVVAEALKDHASVLINGEWITLPDARICPVCHGFGHLTVMNEQPRRCPNPDCPTADLKTKQRALMLMQKSGIGKHYAEFTFRTWTQKVVANNLHLGKELPFYVALEVAKRPLEIIRISDALRSAGIAFDPVERDGHLYLRIDNKPKAWLVPEAQGRSLIFSGEFGVGKTGMAVALLNELMRKGVPVSAVKLMQFIRDIRLTWANNYDGPTQETIARPAIEADYLLIDGMDVKTDRQEAQSNRREIVHEFLVNPRYESDKPKPFIITTNKDKKGFREHWGEDIATRLFQGALWLTFEGSPVRQDATEITMREED